MRVRERSTPASVGDTVKCKAESLSPGGQWTEWHIANKFSAAHGPSTYERSEDVVTTNFKRRIASGEVINNPLMLKRIVETSPPTVTFSHTTTNTSGYGYRWNGPYVPFSDGFVTPAHLELSNIPGWSKLKSDCIDFAVTKALAAVNESEMLALASAYETRETIDFLLNAMRRVYNIARNLRKGRFKRVVKELSPSELSERYMEARYAVRPLYYDTMSVISALEKKREIIRKVYRGWQSGKVEHSDTLPSQGMFYETTVDINRKASYTVSARAGVLCDVEISELTPWGLDKLPETIWEIIPFSFVVDWFANVGDTIAAWTPNSGVRQRASWVTVKQVFSATNSSGTVRSTANPSTWNLTNSSSASGFSYGHEEVVLERFTEPQLAVWPQSNLRLDGFKLVDMGIMLRKMIS